MADKAVTSITGQATFLDFTDLTQLSASQLEELQQAEARERKRLADHCYGKKLKEYRIMEVPSAQLSTGQRLPLVGLGTW